MIVQCVHFAHRQIGSGVPQYRCREMHQSRRLLVQSSCRAEPAQSGNHLTRPTSSTIFDLKSVTLRNHWTVARNRIGVLQRQQWPYAWTIVSSANSASAPRRSATIRGFASLTLWPAYVPASSVKWPRASTGEKAGRPSFCPSSKSSGPWPGAECTSPVYSATTVSDGTTLWTHFPLTAFWYGSFVRSGWRYASPTRSLPFLVSTTEYFVTPPRAMTSGTALSMSQTYSGFLPCGIFTFAYRKSGCAAIARLAGRGHRVVGQISRDSSGLPARRDLT